MSRRTVPAHPIFDFFAEPLRHNCGNRNEAPSEATREQRVSIVKGKFRRMRGEVFHQIGSVHIVHRTNGDKTSHLAELADLISTCNRDDIKQIRVQAYSSLYRKPTS